jgi:hypothetical protein
VIDADNPFARLSEYDLRHLGQHLADRGRLPELHRLLALETPARRNAWYEVQQANDGLPTFTADVERAWRGALLQPVGDAPEPGARRLQLLHTLTLASLNSLAANVPPDLIEHLVASGLWTPVQGLAVARRIPDPERKARALCALARQASALQAAAHWQEAIAALQAVSSDARRGLLLGEAGDGAPRPARDSLERLALELADPDARATALLSLALHADDRPAAQRLLDAGAAASRSIATAVRRAAALRLATRARAKQLGVTDAWAALADDERAVALAELAPALTPALIDQARSLALDALANGEREHALSQLALRCVELGDADGARALLARMHDARLQGRCLVALCAARAAAGDIDAALVLARDTLRGADHVRALAELARRAPPDVARGLIAEASERLARIFNLRDRAAVQALIAQGLAAQGDSVAALRTARAIELPGPRVQACVALAACCPQAVAELDKLVQQEDPASLALDWSGLPEGPRRRLLQAAVRRAGAIGDLVPQVLCVSALQPLDGAAVQAALQSVELIANESDRARALAALARDAPADTLAAIHASARSLSNPTSAGRVLAELLPRELAAGLAPALEEALGIADPTFGCEAMLALTPRLPADMASRVRERAQGQAQAISDPVERAQVLGRLAAQLDGQRVDELAGEVTAMVSRLVALYETGQDIEGASRAMEIVRLAASWIPMSCGDALVVAVGRLKDQNYRDLAINEMVGRAVQAADAPRARNWAGLVQSESARRDARLRLLGLLPASEASTERQQLADDAQAADSPEGVRLWMALAEHGASAPEQAALYERAFAALRAWPPPSSTDLERKEDAEQTRLLLRLAAQWRGLDSSAAERVWQLALERMSRHSRRSALGLVPAAATAVAPGQSWAPVVQTICRWWP